MAEEEEHEQRQQLLGYFQRVEVMLADPDFGADAEQSELFVANVFAEAASKEFRLSCDLVCSRVLERLIQVRYGVARVQRHDRAWAWLRLAVPATGLAAMAVIGASGPAPHVVARG